MLIPLTFRMSALAIFTVAVVGCGAPVTVNADAGVGGGAATGGGASSGGGTSAGGGSASGGGAATGGGTTTGGGSGIGGGSATGGGSSTADGGSAVTGTLGTLGTVQPIVSSLVLQKNGETILYLSTASLACSGIAGSTGSRWLLHQPSGSQVIEVVVTGVPSAGRTVAVPPGEVNYAAGGLSSAYEKRATSGQIAFTSGAAGTSVTGTVQAGYADSSSVSGSFSAEFCADGQEW